MEKTVNIIVAMDNEGAIAIDGNIPWLGQLREDMQFFKKNTVGNKKNAVGMGRKTWDSLDERFKPLPDRENYILTLNYVFQPPPGTYVVHTERAILALAAHKAYEEVWIIGGGEIYSLFLPYAKRILVTHVDTIMHGDVFFPKVNWQEWKSRSLLSQKADEQNKFSFRIVEYTRR